MANHRRYSTIRNQKCLIVVLGFAFMSGFYLSILTFHPCYWETQYKASNVQSQTVTNKEARKYYPSIPNSLDSSRNLRLTNTIAFNAKTHSTEIHSISSAELDQRPIDPVPVNEIDRSIKPPPPPPPPTPPPPPPPPSQSLNPHPFTASKLKTSPPITPIEPDDGKSIVRRSKIYNFNL